MVKKFYLGTHILSHIEISDIPLFISVRTLSKRKKKQFNPMNKVSIDSGGFTELQMFGEWKTSPIEYIDTVRRMESLNLDIEWIASQDYMCEDIMLKKTNKTVREHQLLSVDRFIRLYDLDSGFEIVPVLQGQTVDDYLVNIEDYRERGFDLNHFSTVGVGSVCRRQNTSEINDIMMNIHQKGINIHGFGVKSQGLKRYSKYLKSADSLAWSFGARYQKAHCRIHKIKPKTLACNNCFNYAKEWYQKSIIPFLEVE